MVCPYCFQGDLLELFIWNTTLTAQEFADLQVISALLESLKCPYVGVCCPSSGANGCKILFELSVSPAQFNLHTQWLVQRYSNGL
jgi:hypothetical protein